MSLSRDSRERRRAEIESDLWESLQDQNGSKEIRSRLIRGAFDDVLWSTRQMERYGREAFWWTIGSLATLAIVIFWMAYPSDGETMRSSVLGWPVALIAHNLGFVALIGLRIAVDLRLTTRLFGNMAISGLTRRLLPATVAAAILAVASGLALFAASPEALLANTSIQAKFALLIAALLNMWFLHAVTFRSIEHWDTAEVIPLAARIGGFVSMILWASIIVTSIVAPFWPGWSLIA
jgi:hypothetical protein